MDKIVISGIVGLDGEYPIDAGYFTNRELHTIKRLSGVRVGELDDALEAGDSDLIVAIAAIALQRNGARFLEDMLWDAQIGAIQFVASPVEVEESPPAQGPPASPGSESESGERSGSGSTGSSASAGTEARSWSPAVTESSARER